MFGGSEDRYSAFVSWAKVGLYVGALALLSTMFLFSRRVEVTDSLIYADLNVDDIIRDQRISEPYFTTETESGTGITITAAYAKEADQGGGLVAHDVVSTLDLSDGRTINVNAGTGSIDDVTQVMSLRGDVQIEANDGTTVSTEGVEMSLTNATVKSLGPVDAKSPFGSFTAGAVDLQRTADGYQMTFTDGVRLIYQPKID